MGNVQLREATLETTGVYLCEVSTESPNFETDVRLANLTVRGEQMDQFFLPLFCCSLGHVIFKRDKENSRLLCGGAQNFMKQKEFAALSLFPFWQQASPASIYCERPRRRNLFLCNKEGGHEG
jgi:hypothetical protein